jgi:hypothetical protein
MMLHQSRVLDEKRDLDERLQKLVAFIGTPTWLSLDRQERDRLSWQRHHMEGYSRILHERIEAFPKARA